jgi:glycerol uptake facilitator-like aquaporin
LATVQQGPIQPLPATASCGDHAEAVLAAGFPHLGIGFAGVALAFWLTQLTMAYVIGHISGCHINPAVSFGLWAGGRFPGSELAPYVIAQVLGGIFAAAVLYVIASGASGFSLRAASRPTATAHTRLAVIASPRRSCARS